MHNCKLDSDQYNNYNEILYAVINKAKLAGFKFRNLIDDYDSFTITTFNPQTGRMVILFSLSKLRRLQYRNKLDEIFAIKN